VRRQGQALHDGVGDGAAGGVGAGVELGVDGQPAACCDRSGTYVVTLTDAPVAAYEGELPRLKRTAPKSGNRLDPESGAVDAYRRHLDDRRDEVLDAVPGVKALYDYDFTLNGFAAKLTGR
jgi:hypothetical protein